jgi:hypothetical protein
MDRAKHTCFRNDDRVREMKVRNLFNPIITNQYTPKITRSTYHDGQHTVPSSALKVLWNDHSLELSVISLW